MDFIVLIYHTLSLFRTIPSLELQNKWLCLYWHLKISWKLWILPRNYSVLPNPECFLFMNNDTNLSFAYCLLYFSFLQPTTASYPKSKGLFESRKSQFRIFRGLEPLRLFIWSTVKQSKEHCCRYWLCSQEMVIF